MSRKLTANLLAENIPSRTRVLSKIVEFSFPSLFWIGRNYSTNFLFTDFCQKKGRFKNCLHSDKFQMKRCRRSWWIARQLWDFGTDPKDVPVCPSRHLAIGAVRLQLRPAQLRVSPNKVTFVQHQTRRISNSNPPLERSRICPIQLLHLMNMHVKLPEHCHYLDIRRQEAQSWLSLKLSWPQKFKEVYCACHAGNDCIFFSPFFFLLVILIYTHTHGCVFNLFF